MRSQKHATQLHWFSHSAYREFGRLQHGGDLRKGKRKLMRPLDTKRAMHVVFRSTRATGALSMLARKNARKIDAIKARTAQATGVRVYAFANSGNHLHLLIRGRRREDLQNFLRIFGALVARAITGARKGAATGKFWSHLVYTRVVEWGRAFKTAKLYVIQNELEALGVWAREPTRGPKERIRPAPA